MKNKIPNIQSISGPWGGKTLYINNLPIFHHYKLKINNKYFIFYISYPLKETYCKLKQKICFHWQVGTGKKITGIVETDKDWKILESLAQSNNQSCDCTKSSSPS